MISVKRLVLDERAYCTHCDDRALYKLFFTNPKIVQQGSNGALCGRCMGRLKAAIEKATAPVKKSKKKQIKRSRHILTGKEARYAAKHGLLVWYEERYYDPQDKHLEFNGPSLSLMSTTCCIGHADIPVNDYKDGEPVMDVFGEGLFKVYGVVGVKYHGK
jgi:hypothetical protein